MAIPERRMDGTLVPFAYADQETFFRALDGTHEQAIAELHTEHTMITWFLRGLGFFFMWFGMALVLGPFNAVLDIVPFIGSAGRLLTAIALFPIALICAGVTIVASMIAHSPVMLVLVVLAIVSSGVVLYRRAKQKKAGGTAK